MATSLHARAAARDGQEPQRVRGRRLDAAALADTEHAEVAARAHAHDIHVAGGRSHIGIIYKKPFQTAAQKANAERMRKSRAAKRAAEAHVQ